MFNIISKGEKYMKNALIKVSCQDDRLIPLGLACLQAYLKEHNISVKIFNFRGNNYSLPRAIMDPLVQKKPANLIMNHSDLPILIYLIKIIRNNGFDSVDLSEGVFPLLFKDYAKRVFESLNQVQERYNSILEFLVECKNKLGGNYKKIGFSVFYLNIVETTLLSFLLKLEHPDIQIIWGGPAITQSYNEFQILLKEEICDGFVIGEGEYPLLQFANDIQLDKIEGVMTYDKKSKRFLYQPGIQLDLDILPTPDYTDISLDDYFGVASIYRSRGCTHRCKFCGEWFLFGKKFRVRSIEKVIEDIEIIIEKYNPGYIIFGESLINDNLAYFDQLCEKMIQKKFNIHFGTHFRANITPELAKKAYKAGFNDAWIGIEALTDEELVEMNKGKTANQNIEAIDLFTQAGINVLAMLVVGFANLEKEKKNCNSIIKLIESLSKRRISDKNGKEKKIPIQFKPAPMFLVPGSYEYYEKINSRSYPWKPVLSVNKEREIIKVIQIMKNIPYEFKRLIPDRDISILTKKILDAEKTAGFAISGISGYVLNFLMEQRRKRHSLKILGTIAQKSST